MSAAGEARSAGPPDLWRRERFLVLGWEALGRCLEVLAAQIEASGFRPTAIVAISRGGMVPAVFLANAFGLRDVQVISILRNVSNEKYSERGEPRLRWMAPDTPLDGERVLLVDDIAGDGGTLDLALGLLAGRNAAAVRTAVVVKNQGSRLEPDYRAITVDDWIVFPWEPPAPAGARTEAIRVDAPDAGGTR